MLLGFPDIVNGIFIFIFLSFLLRIFFHTVNLSNNHTDKYTELIYRMPEVALQYHLNG